jgi:hypothetical protein
VVRYSVRRLKKRFPEIPVAVCLWGAGDLAPIVEAAHADATVSSLAGTIDFCEKLEAPARAEAVLPPARLLAE